MSEPLAQPARSSVADGSLPVSSAEALTRRWKSELGVCRACYKVLQGDSAEMVSRAEWMGRISVYESVLEDLRREMAAANVRQPEENTQVTHGRAQP